LLYGPFSVWLNVPGLALIGLAWCALHWTVIRRGRFWRRLGA
jgi:hypothetical protein